MKCMEIMMLWCILTWWITSGLVTMLLVFSCCHVHSRFDSFFVVANSNVVQYIPWGLIRSFSSHQFPLYCLTNQSSRHNIIRSGSLQQKVLDVWVKPAKLSLCFFLLTYENTSTLCKRTLSTKWKENESIHCLCSADIGSTCHPIWSFFFKEWMW